MAFSLQNTTSYVHIQMSKQQNLDQKQLKYMKTLFSENSLSNVDLHIDYVMTES